MNIKVAAFTVSEKSIYTLLISIHFLKFLHVGEFPMLLWSADSLLFNHYNHLSGISPACLTSSCADPKSFVRGGPILTFSVVVFSSIFS